MQLAGVDRCSGQMLCRHPANGWNGTLPAVGLWAKPSCCTTLRCGPVEKKICTLISLAIPAKPLSCHLNLSVNISVKAQKICDALPHLPYGTTSQRGGEPHGDLDLFQLRSLPMIYFPPVLWPVPAHVWDTPRGDFSFTPKQRHNNYPQSHEKSAWAPQIPLIPSTL